MIYSNRMKEKIQTSNSETSKLRFGGWDLFGGFRFGFWIFWLILALNIPAIATVDYVPGEVLVKFKPDVVGMGITTFSTGVSAANIKTSSVQALAKSFAVNKVERVFKRALKRKKKDLRFKDFYKLSFDKKNKVKEAIKAFKADPNVLIAQPNFIYRACATTPDDPYYLNSTQWHINKIQANLAWDKTQGSSSTVIAVLDTGVDYTHEDLMGKVDIQNDYDYVNSDNDAMDDEGHGTNVAGVIAATTNNAKGIAGVDWNAKILPLKVLYPAVPAASGRTSDIVNAIEDAPGRGADIINMSFGIGGSGNDDELMQVAVDSAFAEGAVLVAAAGNDNIESLTYPAAGPNVLAVAATDSDDKRSVWNSSQASNYGTWVDLAAPGSNIYTTKNGGSYKSMNGTSFAAPVVAGVCGLIKAVNPNLTNQQIMNKVIATTDDIDSLNSGYTGKLGSGRVNAYKAAAGVTALISTPEGNSYQDGTINIYGTASGWNFLSYTLEAWQATTLIATIETNTVSVESSLLGSWDSTNYNGQYTLKLTALSSGGLSEEATTNIYVDNTTPEASVAQPVNGASISGTVLVRGTANDTYIDNYALEYGQGLAPTQYQSITQAYTTVESSILGTWETAGLSGTYTVRLSVTDLIGNISTSTVTVGVTSNTSPTVETTQQAGLPMAYTSSNPVVRNSTTGTLEVSFNYTLQGNFNTRIYMFDLAGNLIWQNSYLAGENGGKSGANNPSWDGQDLFGSAVPNGVYLYQIVSDNRVLARSKFIVLN